MALWTLEATAGVKPYRLPFLDHGKAPDRELLVLGAVIATGLAIGIALGIWLP